METLTNEKLGKLIRKSWDTELETNEDILKFILKGESIRWSTFDLNTHQIDFLIIKDPKYIINSNQLCAIFDEGNHCISTGTIAYEENFAYITWSNLGHT